ncbi:hypothetical protein GIB67_031557 [Kingdonia uniflora]|uniref:Uncharacterized protein n=1 Tax=Kingdonia uniflora TaxID=39325 RepID=A0A7J7PBE8_9MAGN|nr:hypothetical protein GIB67_031557 [Kingdonia uniflora]
MVSEEMTITLNNVVHITDLPVMGMAVDGLPTKNHTSIATLVNRVLGISVKDADKLLSIRPKEGGTVIQLNELHNIFMEGTRQSTEWYECAVKAYILSVLGWIYFPNVGGEQVSVKYLHCLIDLAKFPSTPGERWKTEALDCFRDVVFSFTNKSSFFPRLCCKHLISIYTKWEQMEIVDSVLLLMYKAGGKKLGMVREKMCNELVMNEDRVDLAQTDAHLLDEEGNLQVVCIGLVSIENNHFVAVDLKDPMCHLPPITAGLKEACSQSVESYVVKICYGMK